MSRASLLEGFGECPPAVLALTSRLSTQSGRATPVERIKRAWIAGKWAAATEAGRVSSPNRTPTIDLPNRIYAVIRSPFSSSPRVFSTSKEFFAAVSNLEGTETMDALLPLTSETEASGFQPYVLDLSNSGADLGGEPIVLGCW